MIIYSLLITSSVIAQIQEGSVAPDFTLPYLNQLGSFTFSRFHTEKTIIYFWSSLSQQMKEDIVRLQQFHEKYKNKGGKVIAVLAFPEDSSDAKSFLNEQNITVPCVVSNSTVLRNYGIGNITPVIFVVGRKRKVIKSTLEHLTDTILNLAIPSNQFEILIIIKDTIVKSYKPLPKSPTTDLDATIGIFDMPFSKFKRPLYRQIAQRLRKGLFKVYLLTDFEIQEAGISENYDVVVIANIDFRKMIERERTGAGGDFISHYERFKTMGSLRVVASDEEVTKLIDVVSPRREIPGILYSVSCLLGVLEAPYSCTIGLIPRFVFGRAPPDCLVTPLQGLMAGPILLCEKKRSLAFVINEVLKQSLR